MTSCSLPSTKIDSDIAEKISIVEYTWREKPNKDGFDFYLASFHELESDGKLTVVRRDSFNAPLQTFRATDKKLTKEYSEIFNTFPTDTTFLNRNSEEVGIYHGFGYMLLLTRTDEQVTVVDFSPRKAEGILKLISDSLLEYKVTEEMRTTGVDTVSLKAIFDNLARKHVLPLHPLPPNSLPVKVYKRKQE